MRWPSWIIWRVPRPSLASFSEGSRGRSDTEEGRPRDKAGAVGVTRLQAQGRLQPPKRGEAGRTLPQHLWRAHSPADTLISNFKINPVKLILHLQLAEP